MTAHPEKLLAIVVRHLQKARSSAGEGGYFEVPQSIAMTSINSNEMILSCITPRNPEARAIRVPFDPPIAFFEELQLRLNAMRLDAEEDIGMDQYPQVTSFSLPKWDIILFTAIFINLYSIMLRRPSYISMDAWMVIKWIAYGCLFLNLFLGTKVAYLCLMHRTPIFVGICWTMSALLWGPVVLVELLRFIWKARIESISNV